MYSFTQPKWFVWTQCFLWVCRVCSLLWLREIKADGRECSILFFSYFYKKAKIIFFIECTQIKADLYNSDYLHDQEEFASTVGRGINPVIAQPACAQLSILPSQCSLFIIIIKTTGPNIWKNTCSVYICSKICVLTAVKLCKHFVLCGYCKGK